MLTRDILNALKSYTEGMTNEVEFVIQTGEHAKRDELVSFLTDFASVSDKISVVEKDSRGELRSPVSFALTRNGETTGVTFSGVPGGHEFNSLVLATLWAGGTKMKLDDAIAQMIAGVDQPLKFEVFVSLSCHNCPEVVQALSQWALINPAISMEMIDGGLYPELIEERNIQGVPTVFLNGEVFANGKVDMALLLQRLQEKMPGVLTGSKDQIVDQDVTVMGGGPAGVAAAIYAARKGLKVTLVADRIGGQVKDTMGIENLISIPKTTGPEVSAALQQHMNDYDIQIKEHVSVTAVESGKLHKVTLNTGETFRTKTLIVATGAKWRELGVAGEKENIGKGVAYCPHCDGPFFKGKDVAVVGGGNSGIEAALDLAGIVKSVTVFEFMPNLKADEVLIRQARARDNITIHTSVAVEKVNDDGAKVTSLNYKDRDTGQVHRLDLDGVFVQIGLVPNSKVVENIVELTRMGEIKVNERGETSVPGIYACGDVTTVPYKQIVVAMGEGAKAALSAFDYLLKFSAEQEDSQAA